LVIEKMSTYEDNNKKRKLDSSSSGSGSGSAADIVGDIAIIKDKIKQLSQSPRVEMWVSSNERNNDLVSHLTGVVGFKALRAGDIWIVLNGKLLLIIERKEIQDLSASIGKRSKEQKFKLRQMPIDSWRIVYLIEGDRHTRFMKARTAIVGAQANILLRDKMTLLHTKSALDTVYVLLKLYVKAHEHAGEWTETLARFPEINENFNPLAEQTQIAVNPPALQPKSGNHPAIVSCPAISTSTSTSQQSKPKPQFSDTELQFVQSYSTKKQNVENQRTCYLAQLRCIRQMSLPKACAIAARYPTMVQLVAFLADPKMPNKTKLKQIATMVYATDGVNNAKRQKKPAAEANAKEEQKSPARAPKTTRKLGPKLAERIYEFIVGSDKT
jgi:ERCC4-type nuclease